VGNRQYLKSTQPTANLLTTNQISMKIIQSFWSKPFQFPYNQSSDSRSMGGFPLKRYFIYTWAMSILRLKEHFKEVHLVTDDYGKQLLINTFEFPYSSVATDLNDLEDMPSQFWCAGKLSVFSKAEFPFLHFDGDVILGDTFDKSILTAPIIAEYHYEDKPRNYEKLIHHIKSDESTLLVSTQIKDTLNDPNFIYNDYNLGIIGGNDYAFLNAYGNDSLNMIAQNKSMVIDGNLPVSFINCFVDQFNFYNRSKLKHKEVELCIKGKFDSTYDYQGSILKQITTDFSFVHLHSNYKLSYYELPEKWLSYYYPKEYAKINKIIATAP
jgi:hypothetical protein